MPTKLRIPDSYAATLAKLVQLSPNELSEFLEAIRKEQPTLALSVLTESIARRLSLDLPRMNDIVRAFADLQAVREGLGLSVSEFVAELHAAIEATGRESLQPADWSAFDHAVTEALSGDNALAVSSKARSITREYPKAFCSCRILTDLRPIFKSDIEQDPAAFVLVHSLRLSYHQDDEHHDFYIALDQADLEELGRQIQRAQTKEASLRELASRNEMSILEG